MRGWIFRSPTDISEDVILPDSLKVVNQPHRDGETIANGTTIISFYGFRFMLTTWRKKSSRFCGPYCDGDDALSLVGGDSKDHRQFGPFLR
jgi:hypothetical protein